MSQLEATLLARLTWFVGILVFCIGLFAGRDSVIIVAGLAIAAGMVSMALLARRPA